MDGQFLEYVLRRRRFWFAYFAVAALALAAIALIGVSVYFRLEDSPWVGLAVIVIGCGFAIWVARAAVAWYRLLSWPCPQCHRSFVLAWWSSWPGDECKHCGLKADCPDPGRESGGQGDGVAPN